MSLDFEDMMKRVECPACEKYVEDFAPGVSSVAVEGILYHPACAPAQGEEGVTPNHETKQGDPPCQQ